MIIYDRDKDVAAWYASKLELDFVPQHQAIGLVDSNQNLVGAVLLLMESPNSASVTIYSEAPSLAPWAKECFGWMFDNYGRITARTEKSDKRMLKHYRKLGFKFECVAKDFFGPGADGVQHYLTREKCRWIDGLSKRAIWRRRGCTDAGCEGIGEEAEERKQTDCAA